MVTVNPLPVLSSTLAPSAICSGTTCSYTPTSATAAASFSWTRPAIATINANGAGGGVGPISETLTSTATAPVVVTYNFTTSANGCSTNQSVLVTVNPTPVRTSALTIADVCSGNLVSYTPTSSATGVTLVFSWTRASVGGITPATTSGTGAISETLTSTNTSNTAVVYAYTMTANGCAGTPFNMTVNIKPIPVFSSSVTQLAVCSGSPVSYTPASATPTATFAWSRAAVTGISNVAASGSG